VEEKGKKTDSGNRRQRIYLRLTIPLAAKLKTSSSMKTIVRVHETGQHADDKKGLEIAISSDYFRSTNTRKFNTPFSTVQPRSSETMTERRETSATIVTENRNDMVPLFRSATPTQYPPSERVVAA
jgi:hypothetical protein